MINHKKRKELCEEIITLAREVRDMPQRRYVSTEETEPDLIVVRNWLKAITHAQRVSK